MADLYDVLKRDYINYLTNGYAGERADFRNQDLRVYRNDSATQRKLPWWIGRDLTHSVVGCYWEADSYFIQVVSKLIYTNRR